MDVLNSAIVAANLPLRLTISEMGDPSPVIDEFFCCFSLDDCRQLIGFVFDSTVSLSDDSLDGASRPDLQWSRDNVIRVIEAVYWLCKGPNAKSNV